MKMNKLLGPTIMIVGVLILLGIVVYDNAANETKKNIYSNCVSKGFYNIDETKTISCKDMLHEN